MGATATLAPTSTITSVPVPVSSDYTNFPTLAYDSGKGEIFAQYNSISGTGVVAVISDSTNKVITNISETQGASAGYIGDVVYDSGKGEIYAAYGNARAASSGSTPLISVISDSNNTLKTISWNTPGNSQFNWPTQPNGLVYDSGKGEIFVSDISDGAVYVLSDSTNAIVATIAVKTNAGQMVYDSAKSEVFIANSYQISVIDDSTNKIVANISATASGLAYDSSKGEVFAISGTTVSVISDSTNQVVSTITGITGASSTIAYDSTKGEIFAGAVISDTTNAIVAQLPVGIQNIVYDSGKGEIVATYVPNYYSQGPGIDLFSDSSSAKTVATTSSASSSIGAPTTAAATSVTLVSPPSTSLTSSSGTSSTSSNLIIAVVVIIVILVLGLGILRRRRRGT